MEFKERETERGREREDNEEYIIQEEMKERKTKANRKTTNSSVVGRKINIEIRCFARDK